VVNLSVFHSPISLFKIMVHLLKSKNRQLPISPSSATIFPYHLNTTCNFDYIYA